VASCARASCRCLPSHPPSPQSITTHLRFFSKSKTHSRGLSCGTDQFVAGVQTRWFAALAETIPSTSEGEAASAEAASASTQQHFTARQVEVLGYLPLYATCTADSRTGRAPLVDLASEQVRLSNFSSRPLLPWLRMDLTRWAMGFRSSTAVCGGDCNGRSTSVCGVSATGQ
jgi:hypothetical protein